MPYKSGKAELLEVINNNAINDLIMLDIFGSNDEKCQQEMEDEIFEEWTFSTIVVNSLRYSSALQHSVPKNRKFFTDVLPNLDEKRFRQIVRVSRTNFLVILDLIKDDEIFQGPRSCMQFPIEMQLAIVLYRLGSSGEGSSVAKVAGFFGVGDGGTLQRITERIFRAILKKKDKFLYWPDAKERLNIVSNTYHELPHCIGYVDGTEIKLAEKPVEDPDSYFSRKHIYSLKVQVVCDYQLRVRHMVLGYPGSVHDSRIYTNCELSTKATEHLSGAEWLAADSAYKLTTTVITPFGINSNDGDLDMRNNFNKIHSKYRVRVENCFGIVKERFNSLKELKIQIKNDASVKFACRWILVCAILHNIIMEQKNGDVVEVVDLFDDNAELDQFANGNQNFSSAEGDRKRRALVEIIKEMNT